MSQEDQIALEEKIEKLGRETAAGSRRILNNLRQILNQKNHEIISIYSNELRNISIVSGVIAPLSLSLLDITKLNTNSTLLLGGFCILLGNIIVGQFLFRRITREQDHIVGKAEIEWFFAWLSQDDIEKERLSAIDKIEKQTEILDGIDKVYTTFDVRPNIRLNQSRETLRRYNSIMGTLFATGVLSIICSIVI